MKKLFNYAFFLCFIYNNFAFAGIKDYADGIIEMHNPSKKITTRDRTILYGGGYTYKVPNIQLTPFNVQAPKINAGCGGIDFTFGSLSFLGKEQIVKFGKNILKQSPGVAFDLALKTLCPSCADTLKSLESMANQINNMSLDSCNAATALGNMAKDSLISKQTQEELANGTVNEYLKGFNKNYLNPGTKQLQKFNNWLNSDFSSGNEPKIIKYILQDSKPSFIEYFFKDIVYFNDTVMFNFLKSTIGDIYVNNKPHGNKTGKLTFYKSLSPLKTYFILKNKNVITNSEKLINRLIGTKIYDQGEIYINNSYLTTSINNTNFPKGLLIRKFSTIIDGILSNIETRTSLNNNQVKFLGYFKFPVYKIFNVLGGNPYTLEILIQSKEKLSIMLSSQIVYELLSVAARNIQMRISEIDAYYDKLKTIPVEQAVPSATNSSPLREQLVAMAQETRYLAGLSYQLYAKAYDGFLKSLSSKNNLIQQAKRIKQLSISRSNPKMMDKLLMVETMTPKLGK